MFSARREPFIYYLLMRLLCFIWFYFLRLREACVCVCDLVILPEVTYSLLVRESLTLLDFRDTHEASNKHGGTRLRSHLYIILITVVYAFDRRCLCQHAQHQHEERLVWGALGAPGIGQVGGRGWVLGGED